MKFLESNDILAHNHDCWSLRLDCLRHHQSSTGRDKQDLKVHHLQEHLLAFHVLDCRNPLTNRRCSLVQRGKHRELRIKELPYRFLEILLVCPLLLDISESRSSVLCPVRNVQPRRLSQSENVVHHPPIPNE